MTDEEKIAKLKEEKEKLIKELAHTEEETKQITNEIELLSLQTNNTEGDKEE